MKALGNPYESTKTRWPSRTRWIVKTEEVDLKERYADASRARREIGHFIEEVYNAKRLHSSLQYRPPTSFEELHV